MIAILPHMNFRHRIVLMWHLLLYLRRTCIIEVTGKTAHGTETSVIC